MLNICGVTCYDLIRYFAVVLRLLCREKKFRTSCLCFKKIKLDVYRRITSKWQYCSIDFVLKYEKAFT